MTEEKDIRKVSVNENCPHREYEQRQLHHLLARVAEAKSSIGDKHRYLFHCCIIKYNKKGDNIRTPELCSTKTKCSFSIFVM